MPSSFPLAEIQHSLSLTAVTSRGAAVASDVYSFGDFLLDARCRVLLSRSTRDVLAVGPAVDTLLCLVSRAGELVTKDDLLQAGWPDLIVEENTLASTISTLRRVLGDRPSDPRFIATVHRRGYRFIASVVGDAPARGARAVVARPSSPLGNASVLAVLQTNLCDLREHVSSLQALVREAMEGGVE